MYPDTVESEYVNVAEVLFVKLAGSELGVIVGAEGGGDANATDTAQPAPTKHENTEQRQQRPPPGAPRCPLRTNRVT